MKPSVKIELTIDEAAAVALLLDGNPLASVFRRYYPSAFAKVAAAGRIAVRDVVGDAVVMQEAH
jgi:hypothetical protein